MRHYLIQEKYDYIGVFHEGLALARFGDNRAGYIDKTGKVAVPAEYYSQFDRERFLHYPQFCEGLAAFIDKNGMFGYIDKNAKVRIPFEYDMTYAFRQGIAAVKKNGKWGFINKANVLVIPLQYDYVGSGMFTKDELYVFKDGKWGAIDRNGNVIVPFELDYEDVFKAVNDENGEGVNREIFSAYDGSANTFYDGMALVKKNGKYGYADESGKIAVPLKYDFAQNFSEGLAAVRIKDRWAVLEITDKKNA